MTLSDFDVWAEVSGALTAAAVLPFYMGVLHLTLADLLLYSLAAGCLLSAGDQLRSTGLWSFRVSDFATDFPLWSGMVLGLGLLAYLIALVLI